MGRPRVSRSSRAPCPGRVPPVVPDGCHLQRQKAAYRDSQSEQMSKRPLMAKRVGKNPDRSQCFFRKFFSISDPTGLDRRSNRVGSEIEQGWIEMGCGIASEKMVAKGASAGFHGPEHFCFFDVSLAATEFSTASRRFPKKEPSEGCPVLRSLRSAEMVWRLGMGRSGTTASTVMLAIDFPAIR